MVVVWADGRRVVVLRDFLSVERGFFTINVTSCVESLPLRVRWTGGYQPCVDRCIDLVLIEYYEISARSNKQAMLGSDPRVALGVAHVTDQHPPVQHDCDKNGRIPSCPQWTLCKRRRASGVVRAVGSLPV